jgi:ATP-dependent exoDNAse (exonuclease V) alpha subunit
MLKAKTSTSSMRADAEEGVRKLLAIVRERIPKRFGLDPVRDIQVLCPMNRGGLGARSLNIELQNALNPPGDVRIDRRRQQSPADFAFALAENVDKGFPVQGQRHRPPQFGVVERPPPSG